MKERDAALQLDARTLRDWPLPALTGDADKESRGRVVVIGGSREIPGAALLAATAALRAGAGKLVIATAQSAAAAMVMAMPEARIIGLPETPAGGLTPEGVDALEDVVTAADAVLVGPGFSDEDATVQFVLRLLRIAARTPLVLDALAMNVQREVGRFAQPVLLSPHAGEMAQLCGDSKDRIECDAGCAADKASAWNACVVLKGAVTRIADPSGRQWAHEASVPGLATSGSGDVLAGLIAGLAARGAPLEQAGCWGVVLHSMAGARLSRTFGPLGLLARELPGEVPALMHALRPRRAVR
ncbi:NAD(P)H-hydrate dehydratase [Caenimonas aquaedulcis]|uniref:ADP-dependent (S)-NAD(P)H-hydrate dehydratase n=1 Tax=Caenimonas aquaedulcis TaxID=2793270 RepID=A0A931MI21_9BURK|nr:NAD(P)H-hydrate dehydratase [Caenimonas aquaedulcis]MBG9389671.1 NAD(P)H-hydrate dehydratase [Caenimonas aquaedulcis]